MPYYSKFVEIRRQIRLDPTSGGLRLDRNIVSWNQTILTRTGLRTVMSALVGLPCPGMH